MLDIVDHVVGDWRLRVVASEQTDGDFHPERVLAADLEARQIAVTGARVALTDQVHGVAVHQVAADFDWPLDGRADVLVGNFSSGNAVPMGIWAGDCAPIFLLGDSGTVVAAHGGWRGLAAGVIDVAVAQFTRFALPGEILAVAAVGPVIHPCCYEFDAADIAAVARGVHAESSDIAGMTGDGQLALDVPAALRSGLQSHGIVLEMIGPCTGCSDRWFSHRVRGDIGRHAAIAWSERLPA